MHRLLFTRRWLAFTALAVAVACACVALGSWQLDRAGRRTAAGDAIAARADLAPVPVRDLLAVGADPPPGSEWRPVSATGRYDEAGTLLVRNRTLDGRTGYHVLVPLRLDGSDGSALLVDRGFAPRGQSAQAPVDVPPPPPGEVTVTGRVRAGDSVGDPAELGRSDRPQPSISRIDVSQIAVDSRYPLLGGYVELVSEDPPPARGLVPLPAPEGDNPGINYSYAVQWFLFAVVGLAGLVILLRREAQEQKAPQGGEPGGRDDGKHRLTEASRGDAWQA